ncbi:MAG: VOC family protein [Roseiflexaceae bacterium]|nr:VOC family protein [Roseiflexaceae bacterium]
MIVQIDPRTAVGVVTLSVADLVRSLEFYQRMIGLELLAQDAASTSLGAGGVALLHLHESPGARHVRRATGLYHFALRVPERRDLARVLRHFAEQGFRIDGAADHIVSEALYLSDPDGHGIEIYCDRPRSAWYDRQGQLLLASDPIDLPAILAELRDDDPAWQGLPDGTDMGHIHLQVADLAATERFYLDILGFERMARMPSASFVGAGGYHHHIGMNTWAGVGVPVPPEGAARLLSYELVLPDQAALDAVLDRLRAAMPLVQGEHSWVVDDPSQIRVLLRAR